MSISRDHKTANTFSLPLRQATPRMLKSLSNYFRDIEQPETVPTSELCQNLSEKSSWTIEDVARVSEAVEKIDLIFEHLTDEIRERLEAAGKTDAELNRYNLLARGGKMLTMAAQVLTMNVLNEVPGLYVTGSDNMIQVYLFLAEVAQFAKLVELKGGNCRCGCTFSGPADGFAPIYEQMMATFEEEIRLQDNEIKENMANFASTEIDLEVLGALFRHREKARRMQEMKRNGEEEGGGIPASLQQLAASLGLNLPPG